jgi:hypothetical protein
MNPARTGRGGTAKARDIAQTKAVTPESAEPDVATPVAPQTPEVAPDARAMEWTSYLVWRAIRGCAESSDSRCMKRPCNGNRPANQRACSPSSNTARRRRKQAVTCSMGTHLDAYQFRQVCGDRRTVYRTFDADSMGAPPSPCWQLAEAPRVRRGCVCPRHRGVWRFPKSRAADSGGAARESPPRCRGNDRDAANAARRYDGRVGVGGKSALTGFHRIILRISRAT